MKTKPKTYAFFVPNRELSYVVKVLKENNVRHWPFHLSRKDNNLGYTIEVEDHPVVSFFLLKYS